MISAMFNGQGNTRTTLESNLINCAISIPLALILIPKHGVQGFIASIITAQFISTGYGLYQIHRIYNMTLEWFSSLKIVTASLSSALIVYILLRLDSLTYPIYGLAFGGILYLTSFLVLAPILGAVNMEDIENIDSLINELPLIYPIVKCILRVEKKILDLKLSNIKPRASKEPTLNI